MIRRLLLGAAVSVIMFTVGVAGLGWKPYVVMSESMAPSMHAGDLIFVDPHAESVSVYEIVTYTDPRGPIWAHEKGKTMGPGVNSQLKDIQGAKKQELKLVDKNSNKDEMTLHYQLNFVGPGNTLSVIDPDIKNGGKPSFHTPSAAVMLIGAAVLAVVILIVVRNFRGREAGPGDINRGA